MLGRGLAHTALMELPRQWGGGRWGEEGGHRSGSLGLGRRSPQTRPTLGRPMGRVCLPPLSLPVLLPASQPGSVLLPGLDRGDASWLQNLWGPVQKENAGPLVQNVLRAGNLMKNMKPSMGPQATVEVTGPCCGVREEGGWEGPGQPPASLTLRL